MGKKSRRNRIKGKIKSAVNVPLAQEEDNHEIVGSMQAVVLKLRGDFVKNASAIMVELLRALNKDTTRAVWAFVKAGGIDGILVFMLKIRNDPLCMCVCCTALSVVANSLPKNACAAAIAQSGGIPTIVQAIRLVIMFGIPKDMETTYMKCMSRGVGLVGELANEDVTAVQRAGGIAAIVEVLQYPFTDEETKRMMHHSAVHSLVSIMMATRAVDLPSVLAETIRCGGVPTLVRCLKQYPHDLDIQAPGCAIMAVLANPQVGGNPSAVLAAGADSVMEMALKLHKGNYDMQSYAADALFSLNEVVPQCQCCGKKAKDLMVCCRCEIAWYCNNNCILRDWVKHKEACNHARWKHRY